MKDLLGKKIFTYKDIGNLPEGCYEIIDGARKDMTPTGFEHGDLEARIGEFLRKHLKKKGYTGVGEIGILISKDPLRIRAADVVYISKERSPQRPKGILQIPPDLIIEIISENNTVWEINEKVKDYLHIGVKHIVLVDPLTEIVSAYQKGKKEAIIYNFNENVPLIGELTLNMRDLLSG